MNEILDFGQRVVKFDEFVKSLNSDELGKGPRSRLAKFEE
jgi:hypothetical protein